MRCCPELPLAQPKVFQFIPNYGLKDVAVILALD
jgi:hypothetical protein